jgi:23S rRNA (uracil1939-C5)-methyltransferase
MVNSKKHRNVKHKTKRNSSRREQEGKTPAVSLMERTTHPAGGQTRVPAPRNKTLSSRSEREKEAPVALLLEGATPVKRGQERVPVIDIVDIAFPNNYGIGKIDGYVLFVPGAIPQDRIRVEIVDRGKRFGYGKIVSIEEPSPFRVEPSCPHFGLCGGCTLQNLTYNHQLIIKENYLRQTLKRLGNIDLSGIDVSPITPSPKTSFYRSKIELAFGEQGGQITLGLRERASPFKSYNAPVVPLRECPAFSPLIEKIIPVFADFAQANRFIPYNPITRQGFLRHLIIRESKSTGELMCILETTKGILPDMKQCWQTLTREVPEVTSFYRTTNNGQSDVIRYEKTFHIAGKSFIEEKLGLFMFRIHPQSFFQPNIKAAEKLYERIPDLIALDKNQTVLGLYCGTGPIEIFLSPYVREVIGIDSLPENITNAIENSQTNTVTNCSFHATTVESLLKNSLTQKPDILLIDPPRGGITYEALMVILELGPAKIVYISCNPSTLARDLKLFHENSYIIEKIAPFDFFPHASHLETVVCLHRY